MLSLPALPAREQAFDRLSLSSLPGVAGGHAAIFAVFALLNAFALPHPLRWPVVGGNLLAAAVQVSIAFAARRGWIAAGHAAAVTAGVHLVSIGVVLNAYRLLGDPMRAVFVSLGIVSAGWFVTSLLWLAAVVAAALGGWMAVAVLAVGDASAGGHGLFYLLASVMLGLVVHRVRRRNFRQVIESEEALRDLVDNGGVLVQSVSADGVVRFVNRAWSEALGWAPQEVVGRSIFDFVHPDGLAHCRQIFPAILEAGDRHEVEIDFRRPDGSRRTLQGTVTVRRDRGRPLYTRGMLRDVTERRRLAADLRSRDALLRRVAEVGGIVFWSYDVDRRRFTYVSPGLADLSGYTAEELQEDPARFFDLFFPEDAERMRGLVRTAVEEGHVKADHRLRHRDGGERWVQMEATLLTGEMVDGRQVVGVSEDISERKRQEGELERLATVDSLTGLANRRRFDETVIGEWKRHARTRRPLSLLIVDVDHFKRLNDSLGHAAGDACLQEIAAALERSVQRVSDLTARIGGEEFALVLPDTPLDGALEVAERVHAEVAKIESRGRFEVPTVSVGVASQVPTLDQEVDALVTSADVALYAAKRAGRDRTEVAADGEVVPGMVG